MRSSLRVELRGREDLAQFAAGLDALEPRKADLVVVRALKKTGGKARTQVVKSLAGQTGLKQKLIRRAVRTTPPNFRSPTYVLRSAGGDIGLKYFGPRETARGVSARPFGKRTVFPGTFTHAGFWPKRVKKPKWNRQVFYIRQPRQLDRSLFAKAKSGVVIPDEMIKGATLAAFERVVDADLAVSLGREIDFVTRGLFK